MSKPMLVTLPCVLLLLDYWPLGRWQKALSAPAESRYKLAGKLLWEKVPFILLTVASSTITFWAQKKGGSVASEAILPYVTRAANAIFSYVAYLGKTFWPVDLAVFYPYEHYFPLWQIFFSFFILIVITFVVIYAFKKLPFLFVGWFWYLGTLIPVIGLVAVGRQEMADRYTYLPSIGIAVMLAWGIPLLFSSENIRKKILFPAGIAVIAILAVLTWQQCGYWKDSGTLFKHASHVTKDNYLAYNCLGDFYGKLGQYQSAIENFNEVIRLKPDYAGAYNGLGSCYESLGQGQLAIENFNKAILLKPDYAEAYNNRGVAYFLQNNKKLGCLDAQKACELRNCQFLEMAKGQGDCH
jgi:tetratricopeptide (TPR) repeat protein